MSDDKVLVVLVHLGEPGMEQRTVVCTGLTVGIEVEEGTKSKENLEQILYKGDEAGSCQQYQVPAIPRFCLWCCCATCWIGIYPLTSHTDNVYWQTVFDPVLHQDRILVIGQPFSNLVLAHE